MEPSRLNRTEALISGSHEEHRIGTANWLGQMLHQPPLARPDPGFEFLRAFVESLWWDLHDVTMDPESPVTDEGILVPATHPRLIEHHPWQRDDE